MIQPIATMSPGRAGMRVRDPHGSRLAALREPVPAARRGPPAAVGAFTLMAALVAALIIHLFGLGHGDPLHGRAHAVGAETLASSLAWTNGNLDGVQSPDFEHAIANDLMASTGAAHDEGSCGEIRRSGHGATAVLSTGGTCPLRVLMAPLVAFSPTATGVAGRPPHLVRDLGVQRI